MAEDPQVSAWERGALIGHDNNPNDGSNWELLCIYCHDEEHTKFERFVRYGSTKDAEVKPAAYNLFADLKAKMKENE